jgi:hypothetical protein
MVCAPTHSLHSIDVKVFMTPVLEYECLLIFSAFSVIVSEYSVSISVWLDGLVSFKVNTD